MYTPIKLGYKDKKSQIDEMKKYGYYRDDSLSNDNEQVYWNPTKKKLLYNVTGTHNLSDWGTDVYLGTGRLKQTNRYKEADDILAKSKAKYGVKKATIVGHSLGGSVSNGIAHNYHQEGRRRPPALKTLCSHESLRMQLLPFQLLHQRLYAVNVGAQQRVELRLGVLDEVLYCFSVL